MIIDNRKVNRIHELSESRISQETKEHKGKDILRMKILKRI